MDAADFPGEGNPLNSPESAAAFPDDMNIAPNTVDRKAFDYAISSLGGPIHKAIVWYMNNRGVFGDSRKVDTSLFYQNLKELLGPGADMIMGDLSQYNAFSASPTPKILINGNGRNDEPPSAAGCTNQPKSTGIPDEIKHKSKK